MKALVIISGVAIAVFIFERFFPHHTTKSLKINIRRKSRRLNAITDTFLYKK
tara:strand:+ start:254 stop:409 length:156 start_codon:yes stop_codon:yes gene_type:complete